MEGDDNGTDLKQAISDNIRRCMPSISLDKALEIAEALYAMNLRRLDQLQLVTEQDLDGLLSQFEARELIVGLKGVESHTANEKENRRPRVVHEREEREWDFKIDWKDIYNIKKNMKKRLIAGKKLSRKDRKQVVARIVQQVRDRVPHADRSIFNQVARAMRKKYKVTFESELAQGKLARKTLCFKMKTKFDNDKRPTTRKTATESEAPKIKAAYGCTRWRITNLPAGETAETLEEKRLSLEDHFETQRPSAWDWEFINSEMEATFGQQRSEINQQAEQIMKAAAEAKKKKKQQDNSNQNTDQVVVTTTSEIRNRWPFLFVASGMLMHFTKLTEVNLEEKTEVFMDSELRKLIDFLKSTNNNDKKRKNIIKKMDQAMTTLGADSYVPEFGGLILLLLHRFKEKGSSLWLLVDEHMSEEELKEQVDLPSTPCLIIKGDSIFTEGQTYFTMDGQLLGTAKGLIEGVLMLFASYFVFNLNYAPEAQVTLDFIQRLLADMNPPRGNKRPGKDSGGQSSSMMIHHLISRLNEKYDEYLADIVSSSEGNSSEQD